MGACPPLSADMYEEKKAPMCLANGDSVCFMVISLLRWLGKHILILLR